MSPIRQLVALMWVVCLSVLPLAAQNNQLSRTWLMRDGTKMQGSFVKLLPDKLLIKEKGSEVPIPREWLSPASLELAEAIGAGMSDKVIDSILMMEFVYVSADKFTSKTFNMGAPKEVPGRQEFEPFHHVKITKGFHLKQTEVTWAEWNAVRQLAIPLGYTDLAVGRNGYQGDESGSHPVTEVSWWDAVKWCNAKSQIEDKTAAYFTSTDFGPEKILRTGTPAIHFKTDANGYRLPTEAEWELAWHCGGWSKGFAMPDGWHCGNSNFNTHPVRTLPSATANRLHDMLGNVAEWCWDWKGPMVPFSLDVDPRGPESGPHRVFRGGSWADHPQLCYPTYRGDYSPVAPRSCFIGFRPARNAAAETP